MCETFYYTPGIKGLNLLVNGKDKHFLNLLAVDIHLIENNAKVGARIAVALSALKPEGRSVSDQWHMVSNKVC